MRFLACVLAILAVVGVASAGFLRSGWNGRSSPVVTRVIYRPSYSSGWSSGYGGYGGGGISYGGYGGSGWNGGGSGWNDGGSGWW